MPHKSLPAPTAPPHPLTPAAPDSVGDLARALHVTPAGLVLALVLASGVGAFFLAVFLLSAGEAKARRKVLEWAQQSGYELIKQGVVKGKRGPFQGRPAWQTVCAFTVRLPQGWNRSGWICFGNLFTLGFGKPEVHWDEEAGKLAV